MFKYIKEMRELKKSKLQFEVLLFSKIYEFSKVLETLGTNVGDVVELSQQMNGATPEEIINAIVGKLDTKKDGE